MGMDNRQEAPDLGRALRHIGGVHLDYFLNLLTLEEEVQFNGSLYVQYAPRNNEEEAFFCHKAKKKTVSF